MDKPLRDLIEIIHFTEDVSAKIHGVLDETEIYRIVREEFAKSKRYSASIVLLTDDGSKLRIAETSLPPRQLKVGEKATGLLLKGFRIDLNKSSIYSQVVREGKTLQVNVGDVIDELFPRPLAYLISKTIGYEKRQSILTPLTLRGKIIGALAMSSTELAEYFIPSVRNLAQHISITLELADEYAERVRAEERLKKYQDHLEELAAERTAEFRKANEQLQREITKRVWAERAVQDAREYAESVVETVREPLVVLDADLRVVSANRSFYQTFQVTPEETEGQLLYDLGKRQWDIPGLRELLEKILPENTAFDDLEVEHDLPTIGRRVMLLNARRIYREANKTQLILLAIEDVTERERAKQALKEYSERLEEMVAKRTKELQEAQEQLIRREKLAVLGQLAGGVGHELRNPLGAIKNAAYFLNMALEEPEAEVKETLEILEMEVATCERIISSLLDFARPKPPIRRKVDVNAVVQEVLSRTSVPDLPAQAGNIEVVSQLDETLPAIVADPDQLVQVFGNIILNGIQAMPEGGRLIVKSEVASPEWVAVSFADTGVGIPEENLGRLFEPLFTTKAKGIGLGLAVSKQLVEGYGGTIEVESEVGKGSTFTVRLPLAG